MLDLFQMLAKEYNQITVDVITRFFSIIPRGEWNKFNNIRTLPQLVSQQLV